MELRRIPHALPIRSNLALLLLFTVNRATKTRPVGSGKKTHPIGCFHPVISGLVYVFFARCRVESVTSPNEINVFFLDHGGWEEVAIENVRLLPRRSSLDRELVAGRSHYRLGTHVCT